METIVVTPRKAAGDNLAYFLAGHMAPAGTYRRVGTDQQVRLDQEDVLPATCDGSVAVYVRQAMTWAEMNYSGEARN